MFYVEFLRDLYWGHYFLLYTYNDLDEFCGEDAMLFLFADDAKLFQHILNKEDSNILQQQICSTGLKMVS
jgi:hypothetical protein